MITGSVTIASVTAIVLYGMRIADSKATAVLTWLEDPVEGLPKLLESVPELADKLQYGLVPEYADQIEVKIGFVTSDDARRPSIAGDQQRKRGYLLLSGACGGTPLRRGGAQGLDACSGHTNRRRGLPGAAAARSDHPRCRVTLGRTAHPRRSGNKGCSGRRRYPNLGPGSTSGADNRHIRAALRPAADKRYLPVPKP